MATESVSIRLDDKESEILDRYHARLPAMSRSGCLRQLLHDWDRGNGGMRNREELDREIQQRAATITLNGGSASTSNGHWMALVALVWAQNRLYGWGGAIEAAKQIVAEVHEAKVQA